MKEKRFLVLILLPFGDFVVECADLDWMVGRVAMKYYLVAVIMMHISYTSSQYTPIHKRGYCATGGTTDDHRTPLVRNLHAFNHSQVALLFLLAFSTPPEAMCVVGGPRTNL
jgi:hypothetical protein